MTTFVLVHGGWQGAWCWRHVSPLLEAAGHTVVAPDLPGHGDDPTPVASITLASYVDCVGAVLGAHPEAVVLVGHSMSGMVITQAAEQHPGRIHRLVYVAAFLPRNGQSLAELVAGDTASLLPPNSLPTPDGNAITLRAAGLRETLYADCPEDDLRFATARLVAEPLAPLATPVMTTPQNFGRVPRAYVECLRDRALPLPQQRRMQAALPCGQVMAVDTSHSPFFAAPARLVECLSLLADDISSGR